MRGVQSALQLPSSTPEGKRVDLAYRSPFDGDTDLVCEKLSSEWWLWLYQGIAVAMHPMQSVWTTGQQRQYIARRDANLMGMCPLCDAKMPVVIGRVGTQHGAMIHENDCPVSDDSFGASWTVA